MRVKGEICMKKILFSANLDSFFIKFLIPYLKFFKDKGYEIHIAAKEDGSKIPYYDKKFNINFARGLNFKQNLESYKQMKKLLKKEHYDIIFCHTPFGAAITRLAAKKYRKKGTKIIYMAHGFHFYKGAPIFNWLTFYPVEKYLAKHTDILLTMNKEDYQKASKKFKTNVEYMPGVGLDTSKFEFEMTNEEGDKLRKSLKINKDDFVMLYPAEINDNKRQVWLIDALEDVIKNNTNMHLLLPGKDSTDGYVKEYVEKIGLKKNVHLLGFRKDIPKLLCITDLSVSASKREGLPVNILEAIYNGLPIVACDCRGMQDLIVDQKNGFLIPLDDKKMFSERVLDIYNGKKLLKAKSMDNVIISNYSIDNAVKTFESILKKYI